LYDNGIALSGGGARGFAHLGILKAFIENGLAPDIISGVSAGAIVGAFYANGYQPDEILEMFIEKRLFQLIRLTIPKEGLLKPAGFNELFNEYLKINDFSNLKIPLFIAATNINTGKIEYFSQGRLDEKIFASCSIPILLNPVRIGNQTYVDGGVVDNLPVKPLKGKCRKIIGINVNPLYEDSRVKGIVHIAERIFYLNIVSNSREHIPDCDLYIEPQRLKGYGIFEISKAREMYEIGYLAAKEVLESQDGSE